MTIIRSVDLEELRACREYPFNGTCGPKRGVADIKEDVGILEKMEKQYSGGAISQKSAEGYLSYTMMQLILET